MSQTEKRLARLKKREEALQATIDDLDLKITGYTTKLKEYEKEVNEKLRKMQIDQAKLTVEKAGEERALKEIRDEIKNEQEELIAGEPEKPAKPHLEALPDLPKESDDSSEAATN